MLNLPFKWTLKICKEMEFFNINTAKLSPLNSITENSQRDNNNCLQEALKNFILSIVRVNCNLAFYAVTI